MARLRWTAASVVDARYESPTARTLVLDVPEWLGHLPGQHVDVRLTAEDGYTAQRSYSIASAPDGTQVEITVQRLQDGEVSPYLVDVVAVGDLIELRGPVGGWFSWDPVGVDPVLLVAGGSGLVPLMAMVRTREAVGSTAPFRLVCSVRSPDEALYLDEIGTLPHEIPVVMAFTREAPGGSERPAGRVTLGELGRATNPAETVYVCGPTGFVEAVANMLVTLGHDPNHIRTERFGGGRA